MCYKVEHRYNIPPAFANADTSTYLLNFNLFGGCNEMHMQYRFGFNGKEQDFEWYCTDGSMYDFGERMYDSRLGRWLSVDPLAAKYPSYAPYAAFVDNPIFFIDKDGREIDPSMLTDQHHQEAFIKLMSTKEGKAYFSRYMNKGDVLTVGGKTFSFDATGDRAKDVLFLRSNKVMGAYGETTAYLKDIDKPVAASTLKNNVTQGVREVIDLKAGIGADQSLSTLGHEVFLHAEGDANRLSELDKKIESGIPKDEYIDRVTDIGNRINTDHIDFIKNGNVNFKNAFKSLGRMDLYIKNLEKHKKIYDKK